MDAVVASWAELESDHPIPLLHRKRLRGERMLVAHVNLDKGCHVATHSHESEQMACIVSGKVRWRLGEPGTPDYREVDVEGGSVVCLPSWFPHGVDALEDTFILDVLSPPGEMGVDRQS